MSILARITAIVFIVAGLAIILFGIWFGVSGIQILNRNPLLNCLT